MGKMRAASAGGEVRNYVQLLDMTDFVVETKLFPEPALAAYSNHNLGLAVDPEQEQHFSAERGGPQGNYRQGMREKIDNVVECLTQFPTSKRAVITVSNDPAPHHSDDAAAKCVRELQLYIDGSQRLSGTVFLRAQAVSLFPKNIHMVGSIMSEVADRLPQQPQIGSLFYLATILVADRA